MMSPNISAAAIRVWEYTGRKPAPTFCLNLDEGEALDPTAPPIAFLLPYPEITVILTSSKGVLCGVAAKEDASGMSVKGWIPEAYRDSVTTGENANLMFFGVVCALARKLETKSTEHWIPTPHRTNTKRTRNGKKPLFSWHTVTIQPPAPKAEPLGGTHASPRFHTRRGHYRMSPKGNRVWVRDCNVGKLVNGLVLKDYAVGA